MTLNDFTWQLQDENEWVFGKMVRGIVRHPLAEIYFDEEREPSWIWMSMRHPESGEMMLEPTRRGAETYLEKAIEEAEAVVQERINGNQTPVQVGRWSEDRYGMEDFMPRVDGKTFRCSCGCNVFKKSKDGSLKYKCNSCEAIYAGEK